jgi:hypothetical protein
MRAVTAALQQAIADADSGSSSSGSGGGGGSVGAPPALQLLEAFPEVLGWDAARDLAPKLRFFAALGATGQRALQGSLWQPDTQWLPGLKSYHYSVAPKLQLLADTLGGNEAQVRPQGHAGWACAGAVHAAGDACAAHHGRAISAPLQTRAIKRGCACAGAAAGGAVPHCAEAAG